MFHWEKGTPRFTWEGQVTHEKKHVPAPHEPSPNQEKTDSDKANEAPDEVQRANHLRYKEYLGMMKMERHVKRKISKGPTLRMPAPHPSAGGIS